MNGSADVLDHVTGKIALPRETGHCRGLIGSRGVCLTGRGGKLGIDATKKLPGEAFKRSWPPLIKTDERVEAKVDRLLNPWPPR